MRKSSIAVFCVAVAWSASANADPMGPIWERFDRLLCRGETYIACDLPSNRCSSESSRAVYTVDFTTNQVLTFGGEDHPERIVERAHFEASSAYLTSHSAIYTSSAGRVMSFGPEERSVALGHYVPATMTSASVNRVTVHNLHCVRQ